MIYGFAPIVSKKSRLIILGSMPSLTSLDKRQYYGFNRNQFWTILGKLFNQDEFVDYEQKIATVLDNKLALWDTIKACRRINSSDSKITDVVVNNFEWLFKSYPDIEYVFFNGAKSEQVFRKYVDKELYSFRKLVRLPSTSPAYTKKLTYKLDRWEIIIEVLEKAIEK